MFNVVLKVFLFDLKSFYALVQLINDCVFALDKRVDQLLFVVLLCFLMGDLLDFQVDKPHFVCKFFRLSIFTIEVPFKLCHDYQIVWLDHSLETQTKFGLETYQVV